MIDDEIDIILSEIFILVFPKIVIGLLFQALAKEFVLPSSANSNLHASKETTPVVSANCDAEEVTLKLHKDRESPVKGRKLQQKMVVPSTASIPSVVSEHHPQSQQFDRSTTSSVNDDDKSVAIVGDVKKHKDDITSSNTTNIPQVNIY